MWKNTARLTALVGALALAGASPSLADSPLVTVDDSAPAVQEVKGGGYKFDVGLTNITGEAVEVKVHSANPKLTRGCGMEIDGDRAASIAAASHSDLEISFGAGCAEMDVNSVVLGAGPGGTQRIELTPKDPEKATPNWDDLWAFGYAFLIASLLVSLLPLVWRVSPFQELTNLPDTWKFSDSLVTNVTLVGGTLIGVVGSTDVVKAFLGKEADSSIALMTVGAAVAAAIVGLGAVVLQATRKNKHFTVVGLLAAAAVVLAGAGGELYVAWQNGEELTLGKWEERLVYMVVPLVLLLLGYAYSSLRETIEQGLADPKPTPLTLSADAIAATVLVSALSATTSADALQEHIRSALSAEVARQAEETKHAPMTQPERTVEKQAEKARDDHARDGRVEQVEAKPETVWTRLPISPDASLTRKAALL